MGRPAKFDRKQAIVQIMDAIWKDGYEACSIKAISEQLGITRSSYYHAFKSREDLYLEVLDLYFKKIPTTRLSELHEGSCILRKLTAILKDLCKFLTSQPDARGCMIVNSVTELVGSHQVLGPVLEEILANNRVQLEALLSRAIANKEITGACDVPETALALQNLIIGLNVMSKVVTTENELWSITKHTLMGLRLYAD